MSAEVEEMFKKLMTHKGVKGLLIFNADGIVIKSTVENSIAVHYACRIHGLLAKARHVVKELNPNDNVETIRLRSRHEVIIVPSSEYTLVCIQKPQI